MKKNLTRADSFILGNINFKIEQYTKGIGEPDIVAMLEDMKSELCLGSKEHDEYGALIKKGEEEENKK